MLSTVEIVKRNYKIWRKKGYANMDRVLIKLIYVLKIRTKLKYMVFPLQLNSW